MDPARRVSLAARCEEAGTWALPGGGHTGDRFDALTALAFDDLVVGRLVEAHADAVAITAELGADLPAPGERWGVWAAGRPGSVGAVADGGGVRLTGRRPWCSGATLLTHALITACLGDEPVLCAVALGDGSRPGPASWTGPGMLGADTRSVDFDGAPAVVVGAPGAYLDRPGFWIGAVGVAACWFGGAARVGTLLRDRLAAPGRDEDPHALAHLGRVHTALAGAGAALRAAAAAIDADPLGDHRILARSVRSTVERAATEVVDRVGRALGPAPLAHDGRHAGLVADLAVYVRQEHAERDLEALGRDVAATRPPWCAGDDRRAGTSR